MASKIYTDRTEAETEARKLNAERKRTNIEYVVGVNLEWLGMAGKMVPNGFYIGVCSDD